MSKVYVSARIFAKPGKLDEVEAEIRKIIPTVRQEDGCIAYDLHRSLGDEPELLFYEIWDSQAALDAHGNTAHIASMRAAIKDLVSAPSEIKLWSAVDVAMP
jgi:quinol monooxygenase YgiN